MKTPNWLSKVIEESREFSYTADWAAGLISEASRELVGPRPIVQQEIWRYGRYFADYCSVRPGLTGLWQVAGRNDVSYRRRVALDVTYIRNRSVWLNIKILALTIPAVLLRRGY